MSIDLVAFEQDLDGPRQARAPGDVERALVCFQSALDRHTGELLLEDGVARWVVERRDRCLAACAEAAQWLAESRLRRRDAAGGAEAAARLRVDRYRDPLWRLLIATGPRRATTWPPAEPGPNTAGCWPSSAWPKFGIHDTM